MDKELKAFLDKKYKQYNRPDFIANDPISIPHLFSKKQDIEIMGFIASVLAWGQRVTIINKCKELIDRMDRAPYDFVVNHKESDLKKLLNFKHRTFNDTDLLYFISFFSDLYKQSSSLEDAFVKEKKYKEVNTEKALSDFHHTFFSLEDFPERTRKHISSPERKSACKRLNMFLRWMVRKDDKGVDFGIWKKIDSSQLICPCDVHVERVARKLKLITRPQADWQTAVELTGNLKQYDAQDPVKYDFALFGMGVEEKF
ncbi:MAG TPA: TIGR02757 family protein [Cytophagaceae bacterium]|jgi:uncharacterized protein (TIGR02757 family)|nr:TIGR02757 family protein [Cytophagaceae bacterium]